MKATIEINMDNAAFADTPTEELGRILSHISWRIGTGDTIDFPLKDINGNTVGMFRIEQ